MKNSNPSSDRPKDRNIFQVPALNPFVPGVFFFSGLLAFLAGIIAWFQLGVHHLFLILPAVPLLFLFLKERRVLLFVLLLVLFFSLGNLRASFYYPAPFAVLKGTATLISLPRSTGYNKKAVAQINAVTGSTDKRAEIRFDQSLQLYPFDTIAFEGELRQPTLYKNFSYHPGFYQRYLAGRYYLKVSDVYTVLPGRLSRTAFNIRDTAMRTMSGHKGPGRAFFQEVLFGEQALDNTMRSVFSRTGTAHILSISGLHFSLVVLFAFYIVYGVQYIFPRIALVRPRPIWVIYTSLPLLLFYALLSGLSVPSFRSFVIFMLVALFVLLKKAPNAFSLLSLAALLFLVFDPTLTFSLSFQLTFLCVFVLVAFYNDIHACFSGPLFKKRPLLLYAVGLLASSVLISIFTFPLTQTLSSQGFAGGVLANPIAIPVFSFLILPFLLMALAASFVSDTLFQLLLYIPEFGWLLLSQYLYLIARLTRWFAWYLPITMFTGGIYYLTLIGVLKIHGMFRWIVLGAGIFLFFIFMPAKTPGPFVSFLDAGQGDSAVIMTRSKKLVLVDAGGNYWDPLLYANAYQPFFNTLRTPEIEAVFISHGHPDHWSALPLLLKNYTIRHCYFPAAAREKIIPLFADTKTQLHIREQLSSIVIDDMTFKVFPADSFNNENNSSIWLTLETDAGAFLFAGDTETNFILPMMRHVLPLKGPITAVKVPHHGSKNSFDKRLYDQMKPLFAVITVSDKNPWGLPSNLVLEYFRDAKIPVFRTDKHGQILFDLSDKKSVVPVTVLPP